jgi:hypothetical protein
MRRETIGVGLGVGLFVAVGVWSASCGGKSSSGEQTGTSTATTHPPSPPPANPPATGTSTGVVPAVPPSPPDAGAVTPDVACDAGAACTAPSPRCVDFRWLAAFGAGTCVNDKCSYPTTEVDCSASGTSCIDMGDGGSCSTVIIK